jgi:hypothetical protein
MLTFGCYGVRSPPDPDILASGTEIGNWANSRIKARHTSSCARYAVRSAEPRKSVFNITQYARTHPAVALQGLGDISLCMKDDVQQWRDSRARLDMLISS